VGPVVDLLDPGQRPRTQEGEQPAGVEGRPEIQEERLHHRTNETPNRDERLRASMQSGGDRGGARPAPPRSEPRRVTRCGFLSVLKARRLLWRPTLRG